MVLSRVSGLRLFESMLRMVFFSVGVHSFTNNIYEESHREDVTNEQVLKKSFTCICGHGLPKEDILLEALL